jgi:hypothetical protein
MRSIVAILYCNHRHSVTSGNDGKSGLGVVRTEGLLQFWDAVDNAEPHLITQLDLDHLAGETFTHLLDVLRAELQLPPAPFDQVVEQKSCEIVNFIVVGMFTTVENLRHGG